MNDIKATWELHALIRRLSPGAFAMTVAFVVSDFLSYRKHVGAGGRWPPAFSATIAILSVIVIAGWSYLQARDYFIGKTDSPRAAALLACAVWLPLTMFAAAVLTVNVGFLWGGEAPF